jgi:hypothetical protein
VEEVEDQEVIMKTLQEQVVLVDIEHLFQVEQN